VSLFHTRLEDPRLNEMFLPQMLERSRRQAMSQPENAINQQ